MVKKFNAKFRVGQGGVKVVTSDVTLGEGEDALVLADASAGPITITLQRADGSGGKRTTIKKIDTSGNDVIVQGKAGQTIDGGASLTLDVQNDFLSIISDNENWFVESENMISIAIPHNFLSPTHLDTDPATPPATGSLAKGDGANLWAEFVLGAANTALLVNGAGTNLIYALIKNANVDPTAAIAQSKLAAIALADLPNLPALGVAPASPRQTDIVDSEIAVLAAIAQSKIAGLVAALGTKIETSSDVGAGAGITKPPVGTDLPLKTFLGTADQIAIASGANELTFSLNALVARLNVIQTWTANQTFNNLVLRIRNPANSAFYVINASAILADRNAQLPLLTADDFFTFNETIAILKAKTINTDDNIISATAQAAGDLLRNNGVKFVRFAKGTSLQQLRVNAAGTDIEYFTPTVLVSTFILGVMDDGALPNNATEFIGVFSDDSTGTEAFSTGSLAFTFTVVRYTLRVNENTKSTSTTFSARDDGVDIVGTSIVVAGGVTGSFDSGVLSAIVTANSIFNFKMVTGGASGSLARYSQLLECEK